MAETKTPMGWPATVAIVLGAAVVCAASLAALAHLFGIDGNGRTAGIGAATGLVGVLLLNRLRRR
jgi:hypothetical protein